MGKNVKINTNKGDCVNEKIIGMGVVLLVFSISNAMATEQTAVGVSNDNIYIY